MPNRHLPEVYDAVSKSLSIGKAANIELSLWDVSGHRQYDRLRPLSYPRTDGFLLMFDVSDKQTLQSLRDRWLPEHQHHAPGTAFGVVACKTDLRLALDSVPMNDEVDAIRLRLLLARWMRQCGIDASSMHEGLVDIMVGLSQCSESRQNYVRYEDGEHMARELGASGYLECSALSRQGLEEVFEAACQWALGDDAKNLFQKRRDTKAKSTKQCVIL